MMDTCPNNTPIQWNLYNKTGEVLLKTHKFQHLCGTVFTKSCLFSLSWETTCLQRPQNLVVALYRLHCNILKFCGFLTKICSRYVTDLNHSLQINFHFWNKQNHAYQYFNLMGVRDKKKARLFSCDSLGKPDTLAWKVRVHRPYQKVFGLS